ncbi:1107_t:CDS:2, partial [Racocetra persica]
MSTTEPEQMEIEITHEDILEFLHQKQNCDIEGAKKFLEYGSTYLLACYKENVPAHWFCSEEFVEITTELLHIFALNNTNEQVEEFKNVMADQLSNCVDCVEVYYIYKEDMRQRYLRAYNNTNDVNVLFDVTIKAWDRCRVYSALQNLSLQLEKLTPDILTSNSTIAILSEIMFNPSLLADRSISSLYVDLFLSIPQNILKEMCKGFLPGMIIVSVHENDDFRQLFWKIMQGFQFSVKLEDFNAHGYSGPMQSAIRRLKDWNLRSPHFQEYPYTKNLRLYWKGLRKVLCCLDSSTIIFGLCHEPTGFCNLVVSTIKNQEQQEIEFVEILKCLQVLLKIIKNEFWNYSSVTAQDLMTEIFNSPVFHKASESHPKKCKHLLGWAPAFVESSMNLVLTILEYLVHSFQKNSWSNELAEESLDVALKILRIHNLKIDPALSLKLKSVALNENIMMFHKVPLGSRRLSLINEILSLNTTGNNTMSASNNNTMSVSNINTMPASSINTMTNSNINTMSASNINTMSASNINTMSASKINAMSASKINAMSASKINTMSASNNINAPLSNGTLSNSIILGSTTSGSSGSSSSTSISQTPVNSDVVLKKPMPKPSSMRKPISMNTSSKIFPNKKGTISKMMDAFIKENQIKNKERQDMMHHANTSNTSRISNQRLNSITSTSGTFDVNTSSTSRIANNRHNYMAGDKPLDSTEYTPGTLNPLEFNVVQPKPLEQPRRTKLLDFREVISHHRALQDNKQQERIIQMRRREDTMKRLRPNLKSLHKQVLTWNIDSMGEMPPNILRNEYRHIPDQFQTAEEYISIFEPLLVLEIWQSFISAKEEIDDSDSYAIVIDSSVSIDDFIEVSCHSADQGQLKGLSENDLVIVKPANYKEISSSDSLRSKIFLAIAKSIVFNKLNMHCYFNNDPHNIRGELRPRSSWTVEKVISLTPAAREYAALMATPYFKYINLIMQPRSPIVRQCPRAQLERYINMYKINESQAEAVWKVLNNKDNISLVQGPPGTGKTSTIVSIISELRSTSPTYKPRILACAPSNAAVDEIEKRLREGIFDSNGNLERVAVARFGKFENDTDEETSNLKVRMSTLLQEVNEKKRRRQDPRISGWDAETFDAQINKINEEIENIRRTLRDSDEKNEKPKRIVKELNDADIICATLTGSGHDILADIAFQAVIIDEAAQAIELTSLIPMKFNPSWCVLVGDSNQLPPTVLSRVATDFCYEQSLFTRIQRCAPASVHMLKMQYRMHPEICRFPSKLFYDCELYNAGGLLQIRTQRWHAKPIFGPYRFFDVLGIMGQDQNSFFNREEAVIAIRLVETLIRNFPEIDFKDRIGVITPYKRQLAELKRLFAQKIPSDLYKEMEFNTVDGFQGKEKDIIIFSCVRAGRESSVGFLKDIRRMNVALTRAKSSLFILGNRQTLEKNPHWKELIEDAVQRGLYTRCSGYQFVASLNAEVGRSNEFRSMPMASFQDTGDIPRENLVGHHINEMVNSRYGRGGNRGRGEWHNKRNFNVNQHDGGIARR